MSRFSGKSVPYGSGVESREGSSVLVPFFNAVYAWMATGLALTAVVAWYVSTQPQILQAMGMGTLLVLFVVQILLVVTISAAVQRINATVATVLFLVYAALNGLTLSGIFLAYTQSTLTGAFVVTAGMFGAMSVAGFVTKIDLTRLGSFLFMALIGMVLATIVNIFVASTALYWITTYAGVLIFVGLTAYDTQRLKAIAYATANDSAMSSRMAISGALTLYLDFLNLFLMMLRIMGSRR